MSEGARNVLECRGVVRRFTEGGSVLEVLSGVDLQVGTRQAPAFAHEAVQRRDLHVRGDPDEVVGKARHHG